MSESISNYTKIIVAHIFNELFISQISYTNILKVKNF